VAQPAGLTQDLEAVLAATSEIREAPGRLTAIFACRDQQIWQAFNLPALNPVTRLEVGRHFNLAPLLAAAESFAPYAVVLIERGKARGFEARGTEIEEVKDFFTVKDLGAHEEYARTGWSHHADSNLLEKSRSWARELSQEMLRFLALCRTRRVIVGCREDLWGEFSQFLDLELLEAVIGKFHIPSFEVTPAEVLRLAMPLFEEYQSKRCADLVHEIKETPGRRAAGMEQVLARLQEGRVQKLLLGVTPGQKLAECTACGHLQMEVAGLTCRSCSNSGLCSTTAEEAMIRQALLTDAEILVVAEGVTAGFDGVAGLLRY
jgi:peptide subunit release factor 1 (eRF1)